MNLAHPFEIVTPSLDGRVLEVLASGDAQWTGRQITAAVRGSIEGHSAIDRVLARLAAQGIVEVTPAGRANLYRLNREHVAAPLLIEIASLRVRIVEALQRLVEHWPVQPSYAALFGSAARGEAGSASDLDLFLVRPARVDGDDPDWRRQLLELTLRASRMTGNEARILEYGESELRERLGREPVLDEIRRDGVTLTGDTAILRARRRRR